MSRTISIALLSDREDSVGLVSPCFEGDLTGFGLVPFGSVEALLGASGGPFRVILVGGRFTGPGEWPDVLSELREALPGSALVFLADGGAETEGAEAVRAGFDDYVSLEGHGGLERLPLSIVQCLERLVESDSADSGAASAAIAAGIARDFSNILTIAASSMALARLQSEGRPELGAAIEEAEGAILRARALVQQLAILSGGSPGPSIAARIDRLIGEIAEEVFEESPITWELEVREGGREPVLSGGDELGMAIRNILLFSSLSMPGGGHVRMAIDSMTDGAAGKSVRLMISDQGAGIPEEHLESIFRPYAVPSRSGDGLGLPSARSIITRMGGKLSATSRLGEGTTFTVLLPVAEPRAARDEGFLEVREPADGAAERVLMMDGNSDVMESTARVLRAFGYFVSCASDMRQALELCRETVTSGDPFDAVILDTGSTGRGAEAELAVSALLEACPGVRTIASVAGAAGSAPGSKPSGYGCFDRVLGKPWMVDELLAALRGSREGPGRPGVSRAGPGTSAPGDVATG